MKIRAIVHFFVAVVAMASSTFTPASAREREATPQRIYGVIQSIAPDGNSLTFQKRNKALVTVDISEAQARHTTGALPLQQGLVIYGFPQPDGTFRASFFGHASDNPKFWATDK